MAQEKINKLAPTKFSVTMYCIKRYCVFIQYLYAMHAISVRGCHMRIIPIAASAGITGFESPAAEYLQLGLSLDEILIQHPSSTFLGLAQGESMQGVGIFDGDLLIVDRHETAKSGDVIVANFNGEFVCKILDMPRRMLVSSNEQYLPVTICDYDDFSIEGVVTRSIRCHRQSPLLVSK
jgi:DNA polymerase V